MKRLRHWLFNFAAAVSLVLLLATLVAWPVSYWRPTWVAWVASDGASSSLTLGSGLLNWYHESNSLNDGARERRWQTALAQTDRGRGVGLDADGFHVFGFYWASGSEQITFVGAAPRFNFWYRRVQVPLWMLLVALAWPIVLWGRKWAREPLPLHHCEKCGYDLRATPERCPECGTVVEGKKPQPAPTVR